MAVIVVDGRELEAIVATCDERLDGVEAYVGTGDSERSVGLWESQDPLRDGQRWSLTSADPTGSWDVTQPIDLRALQTEGRVTIFGFSDDNSNSTDGIDLTPEVLSTAQPGTLIDNTDDGRTIAQKVDPVSRLRSACG